MSRSEPFLDRMDPDSIRVFLEKYDDYCRKLNALASPHARNGTLSTEPARPLGMVYCVNSDQLQSAIELHLIGGCNNVKELTDEKLRSYFNSIVEQTSTVVSAHNLGEVSQQQALEELIEKDVRMDMTVKSAESRMTLVFLDYRSLLRREGMSWIIDRNPKLAIRHVLSVVKPALLKERLEQDLCLAKVELKKDFRGFMNHALRLSEAFDMIYT